MEDTMKHSYVCGAVLAPVLLFAGCKPTTLPVAADTHDADVKAIRDLEAGVSQAFAARDAEKLGAFYAEDASVLLVPDVPAIKGLAAIKGAFQPFFADKNFTNVIASERVETAKSGDLGYSQGTYNMTFSDPKTGKVLAEKGKYVTVFQKQADGGWKAVEDIFNEDAPPTLAKK
jgi:uncharacterized protein (TIGR02246 family)